MSTIDTTLGGMLTGSEIIQQVNLGRIKITNFDPKRVNPNSYNLSLGSVVTIYKNIRIMDLKDPKTYGDRIDLPIDENDGIVIRPGNLYLIPTEERIETADFIPMITGRSSIGRLGISIHQEAGFGDLGYSGVWTLQVRVTYPVKIYRGLPVAQVYFITPHGNKDRQYNGKYQNSTTAMSSKWDISN